MPGLDITLVCLALAITIYTQSRETSLLFIMFLGSTSAVYLGLHVELGNLWYSALSLYYIIFCALTRSLGISILYFCMQLLCLLSIWEYPTEHRFIYDNFAFTMATLFLIQLGVSTYGHQDDIWYRDGITESDNFFANHYRVGI